MKTCEFCHQPYEPTRSDSRYCSESCRAKAWRRARKASVEDKFCEVCHRRIAMTQPHQPHKYCSQACRQEAYRRRLAERLGDAADLVEPYTLVSASALEFMVTKLSDEFVKRWQHGWRLDFATARKEGSLFYLDLIDGASLAFKNKRAVREFFADYLNTGKPNMAMLRQF